MNTLLLLTTQIALILSLFSLGWVVMRFQSKPRFYLSGLMGMLMIGGLHQIGYLISMPSYVFRIIILGFFFSSIFFVLLDRQKISRFLKTNGDIFLFSLVISLVVFTKLATTPFIFDDEIYSWNYWGIRLANSETISFQFTQATYPLLFSHYLAGVYKLIDLYNGQILIKSTLCISCFSVVYYFLSQAKQHHSLLVGSLILIFLLAELGALSAFAYGLADPLANAFLVVGLGLLVLEKPRTIGDTVVSCAFIGAAALTKQFALVYATLPLVYFFLNHRNRHTEGDRTENWRMLLCVSMLPTILALTWIFTADRGFTDNAGVVAASLGSRSWIEQLQHITAMSYFGITYVVTVLGLLWLLFKCSQSDYRYNLPLVICLIISFIVWSIYGSYDIRLGSSIFLLTWLILISQQNPSLLRLEAFLCRLQRYQKGIKWFYGICIIAIFFRYGDWLNKVPPLKHAFNHANQQVDYLFGLGAYDHIHDTYEHVFATVNYSYGALAVSPISVELITADSLSALDGFISTNRDSAVVVITGGAQQTDVDRKFLAQFSEACLRKFPNPAFPFVVLPLNCGDG